MATAGGWAMCRRLQGGSYANTGKRVDDRKGGDGQLQVGERVRVVVGMV